MRGPPIAQIMAVLVQVNMRDQQVSRSGHDAVCARRSAVSFGACARIRSDQDLLSWSHARKAPCCAQTARAHTSLSPAVAYMTPYTAHIQARACHHSRLHTSPVHRSRGALLRMERPHVRAPRSLLAPGRNVDHPGVTVCAPCAAMQCDTVLCPGALHSPLSLPPRRHGRSVGTRRCTVFSNFSGPVKTVFSKATTRANSDIFPC